MTDPVNLSELTPGMRKQLRAMTAKPRAPRIAPVLASYEPPRALGERHGDTLCLTITTVARPKKNNARTIFRIVRGKTRKFVVPPKAYMAFVAEVETAIMGVRVKLNLPLPAIPYALSVVFFLPDEAADVDNLVVGLNDALQQAGVFTNDRVVRSVEAQAVLDPERPRVAFTLAPFERP
jgi:Holliday junction resolvase RusA-like endonuclease